MAIEENINNDSLNESDGSGGGGGGGLPTTTFTRGCMNPYADNYNPKATWDDGSCIISTPVEPILASNNVQLNISSSPINSAIIIDGVATLYTTPKILTFDAREFIVPKLIKVKFGEYESDLVYKINATKLNSIASISSYKIELGKLVNGVWQYSSVSSLNNTTTQLSLQFESIEISLPLDEVSTGNHVEITTDVSDNNVIKYTTSNGLSGFITNGVPIDLDVIGAVDGSRIPPTIWFKKQGDGDYNISYDIYDPNSVNPVRVTTNDLSKVLNTGHTRIHIILNKVENTNPPTLQVSHENLEYNIASIDSVKLSYTTNNADAVLYTLANTERTLSKNGSISLTNSDFYNGIGQYTMYLQPITAAGVLGELKSIVINVVNKSYLPGPDITNINYPSNIKGADFRGYNEDFKISWQSINTNYIEIYVSKYDSEYFVTKGSDSGALTLNIENILSISKQQLIDKTPFSFDLILIPFNAEGDELTSGKQEKITIVFDKGSLSLSRAQVLFDISSSFDLQFDTSIFDDEISKYLTHYAHLGNGDNKLISTWDIDKETFSTYTEDPETSKLTKVKEVKALVLKLYEPLPNSIQPNQQLWISKIQSIPIVDRITITEEELSKCTILQPNFNLDLGDDIGYQILEELVAVDSMSSEQLVEEYISQNEFSLEKLSITYYNDTDYFWDNFVKYSSAYERVENFIYKVRMLETYNDTLTNLSSVSSTDLTVRNEKIRLEETIRNLKRGFDSFEKQMYSTDSPLSYPQTNGIPDTWNSVENGSWHSTILNSATIFDNNNKNLLVSNLPKHIINDEQGQDFILFFNMIGQHFDVITSYTKGVAKSKKSSHTVDSGLANDLIYHMLESLGWDADMGVKSQYLWEYAFGINQDGTSASSMTGKDRQFEIWRRLLNNLPYLYKHKGTKRALTAAMACYGVPTSMLTILEFGGPQDPTESSTTTFTFDDRTAALNFNGTSSLNVPWDLYNATDFPQAIELRLKTETAAIQNIIKKDFWELNIIPDTGLNGHLEFKMDNGVGVITSGVSPTFPIFNDEFTQIVLNRVEDGIYARYTFYVKEGFNERIRNEVVGTFTTELVNDTWDGIDTLEIGTTLIGELDEFRLWRVPLEEDRIVNHTLLPDAIDGNDYDSSTKDLIFRLDFEYPKNISSVGTPTIKNVSINRLYGVDFATAVGFTDISDYPFQYTPYERTVTANIPSTGVGYSNKIRFESQTLENHLNFGTISNVTKLNNTDDSSKLGLFFSPMKEINMDIVRSLGQFNIDNYIGDPGDTYKDKYSDLDSLRKYYFQRFNLNIYEYIQLVRYIDQTLFTTLESLVPGRAKVSSGLLIEPHFLERSKYRHIKPTAEDNALSTTISVMDDEEISGINIGISTSLDLSEETKLTVDIKEIEGLISLGNSEELSGSTPFYEGTINVENDDKVSGEITPISTIINAQYTGSVVGEYVGDKLQTVGMNKDSITVAGFGLYGMNGFTIRTYIDKDGNTVQDRKWVYRIKESRVVNIPENVNPNDSSQGTIDVPTTLYTYKVTLLNVDQPAPTVGGNIVEVVPLNGYYPSHYRNVGDLTTGLQNSYYNGSKQTNLTTLDAGPAVETFITNPNVLKVSDTGRGSGEPILEVN